MRIEFTKMSGAGNDFVVVDNRDRKIRNGARVARILCDRRWGIGADGLLLLQKSRKADYRMLYYNADGSYGGMCGNGGRCIASFAVRKKIAPASHVFEALDYLYRADVAAKEVILGMKNPTGLRIGRQIGLASGRLTVASVNTGSPHVVVKVADIGRNRNLMSTLDVIRLGREIRYHRAFKPDGTNVNFIEVAGPNSIRIRTYERGVEDETLACGTGSIASALVASMIWKMRNPVTVIPRSGRRLQVLFDMKEGGFTNIRLKGPAEVTFSGFVDI
jgi:diaminopimelate epimerase